MFNQIWKDIKKQKFSPLYILYGEESFLIEETKNLLISNALTDEDLDFNLSVYDLEETPIDLAIEDCQTVPFFGERKVVMMQNPYFLTAEKVKEKVEHNLKTLENYIQDPVPSTIAVLIAPYEKLDERKKLTKSLLKNAIVLDAKKLNERDIKEWIQEQFSKAGLEVTESAKDRLFHLVGTNMSLLKNEIDKIVLYSTEQTTIDVDVIDLLVARSLEENVFVLVEHVLKKDLPQVLEIYFDLMKQNEEPIKILALIASQVRFMYQVKGLLKKGYGQKQMAGILRSHPYRVKLAMEQVKNYEENWLLEMIASLAELDYQMKTGFGDKDKLMQLFFIKFLSK